MRNAITSAVKGGHGKAILIAGVIGLVASDIIPTPGDALYFWDQQRLKKKLENKEITPKQYWIKNALGYYTYNGTWWALVGCIVLFTTGSFSQKIKLGLALTGAGAVAAVIAKNIQKDTANETIK